MRSVLWPLLALSRLLEPTNLGVATGNTGNALWSLGTHEQPCRARAWVRAPDLEAGQVIQGEVKVKLDGTCGNVSSYSLKLRFAERSWVKTRPVGVQRPERPVWNDYFRPLWEKYYKLVHPEPWLVHEEERIGFEIKQELSEGKDLTNDVVGPFAILVPSTVYPPAFGPFGGFPGGHPDAEEGGSEHFYAYFVDVAFTNGTSSEISAGYTSFNGGAKLTPQGPETVNVTAIGTDFELSPPIWDTGAREDPALGDVFTLEVTFPQGRHLEQGSLNNITIVSHQLGPGFWRPERVRWLNVQNSLTRHWAASHAADNETAKNFYSTPSIWLTQLRPSYRWTWGPSNPVAYTQIPDEPMFSEDGIVETGKLFSTNAITFQLKVPEDSYPNLMMQFQTTEASLSINLVLRKTALPEESRSEDPDQEEYDWIPTLRERKCQPAPSTYASIPIFIHPKRDERVKSARTSDGDHYLSPEALAPIFVPLSSVDELLQKSPEDRDSLAPKVQPTFATRDHDNVGNSRYYARSIFPYSPDMPPYYVGNTWLRKVTSPNRDGEAVAQTGGLGIQSQKFESM